MIFNDTVALEYGTNSSVVGVSPIAYQPKPLSNDYVQGFLTRWFAKRVNSNKAIEISPEQRGESNTDVYIIISVIWKISGPKDSLIINRIIEKSGIIKENNDEIQRVKKETGVDLSFTLTNPIELWRGY